MENPNKTKQTNKTPKFNSLQQISTMSIYEGKAGCPQMTECINRVRGESLDTVEAHLLSYCQINGDELN